MADGLGINDIVHDPSVASASRVRLKPIGFWSYSRQDDQLSQRRLSDLRQLVMAELQQQYGRDTVEIFQDMHAIEHGAKWEDEIRRSLADATFFVPIITPNFIQSEWCCAEVTIFLEREKQLFRSFPDLPQRSRMFPLHMIDIAGVEPFDRHVLAEIERRQWFDYSELRFHNLQDEKVHRAVAEFAQSIRNLLHVRVGRPLTEAELKEQARAAAEAERQRAAGAEAARHAELRRQEEKAEAERMAEAQAERARRHAEAEAVRLAGERAEAEAEQARLHEAAQERLRIEAEQRRLEHEQRAAEEAEARARDREHRRMERAAAGGAGWLAPPRLWLVLGSAAILALVLAILALSSLSNGIDDNRLALGNGNAVQGRSTPGNQGQMAGAIQPAQAGAAQPRSAWLMGRWCDRRDGREVMRVAGDDQRIDIIVGDARQAEQVTSVTPDLLRTRGFMFVREGDSAMVATDVAAGFSYTTRRCG